MLKSSVVTFYTVKSSHYYSCYDLNIFCIMTDEYAALLSFENCHGSSINAVLVLCEITHFYQA